MALVKFYLAFCFGVAFAVSTAIWVIALLGGDVRISISKDFVAIGTITIVSVFGIAIVTAIYCIFHWEDR